MAALSSSHYAVFLGNNDPEHGYLSLHHLERIVELNEVDALREFICLKPDLLTWDDPYGRRPPIIIQAAQLGHNEVLEVLLDYQSTLTLSQAHPDPSREFEAHGTPLTAACRYARLRTVQLLLSRNPNLNIEERKFPMDLQLENDDKYDLTPLLHALAGVNDSRPRDEREEVIRLLLDHGANATSVAMSPTTDGLVLHSALSLAMIKQSPRVIKWLIQAGAEPHVRSYRYHPVSLGENLVTPLHIGCFHRNAPAVHTLLELSGKADIAAADHVGRLPLHAVLVGPNEFSPRKFVTDAKPVLNIMAVLLSDDSTTSKTINARDSNGAAPLHLAAGHHGAAVVSLLCRNGASPDVLDARGNTPLHLAADHFKHGFDSEQRFKRLSSIRVLVDNGADPMVQDADGLTAVYKLLGSITRQSGQDFEDEMDDALFLRLLLPSGTLTRETEEPIDESSSALGELNCIIALTAEDSTVVCCPGAHGNTLLHLAARSWLPHTIEILISLGARADARNETGDTPAHVAARMYPLAETNTDDDLTAATARQDRVLDLLNHSATAGYLDVRNNAGETAQDILSRTRAECRRKMEWFNKLRVLHAARLREIARIEALPAEEQWAAWAASKWRGLRLEGEPDWRPNVPMPPVRPWAGRGAVVSWEEAHRSRNLEAEMQRLM